MGKHLEEWHVGSSKGSKRDVRVSKNRFNLRVVYEYSHLGGTEILRNKFPVQNNEIDDIIRAVEVPRKTKVSKEKQMKGRLLYDPKLFNKNFKIEFRKRGWDELKSRHVIELPNYPTKIKGAFKQVDFAKDKILVEVQFGKYFAMFYDLAKFQYFFIENKADVGVEIVPCNVLKKQMSSGVSYGEQLVFDIERLRRNFPAVPVKIILVDT